MRFLLTILVTFAAALPLIAQENRELFPRFGFTAAGYLGDFGTQLRVDPHHEALPGTTIDLEKNLGLTSSRTLTRFGLEWRPFERHEFRVAYFRTQRRGELNIDRQIVYEDTTFPVQADVHSRFDIDFWDASYTYWIRQTARDGIGINGGIMGMSIDGELSAASASSSVALKQTASTTVPIPLIGAEGRYQISSRVIGTARGALLPRVSFNDYHGEASLARASIEYRAVPSVGIGAAYNYFHLHGAVDKSNFHANLGISVSGAEAFVHIVFGTP